MNFLRTPYFRKTSAIIFLALFVFIHAVKALHTHDLTLTSASSTSKNAVTVKTDFYCAICDFQLAKDSDTEVATIQLPTPVILLIVFKDYSFQSVSSVSITSSVRGPPANS